MPLSCAFGTCVPCGSNRSVTIAEKVPVFPVHYSPGQPSHGASYKRAGDMSGSVSAQCPRRACGALWLNT
ncbi:hypothetical protein DPEC_G00125230 [Dallia pectoralis]|uniref:Uncharacterized protein n=1 Tax=Dallia pectoralis TaxID=75939 RepID=A0ACC2GQW8_DALPE|nr:hypothetical protein DPEC_G00125230 [Dallia pectoralis]